ncbi:uncharacterized protein STEHIDRAFT_125560 [Stereum hirsutum FP-91666 SS1]|uniref:uncharacterized protein n=1 Tax=Stereum hirsutum (strain FP-91666) TaxID=721885 RepID=UPI000444A475|nr:uncharacterized protein STEHIDRAFT_125560 [Stereum hirsutum FP-91666 SS1]EIM81302.1 hypothetical protein STEHIDRAFT_125560 [Stereum hirsutum FP-91666 SS1]
MAPPSKAALPLLPVVYHALDSPSRSASSSSLPSIADIIHPRKSRQRTTFVALFALIILSVYVFLVAQPALSPIPLHNADDDSTPWRHMANSYIEKNKHRLSGAPSRPPQISLDPAQELAALTSFMAALPQNVIPSSVDPSLPIDPQLVLDFDTRSPRAESEIQEVVIDAWMRNPVVLFSKVHSPVSREVKSLLRDMHLRPSPTIFDLDERADAQVLVPLLYRLTSSDSLPILLIGGTPVGSIDAIRELDASGELKKMVTEAGAVIDGAKRKKGRRS